MQKYKTPATVLLVDDDPNSLAAGSRAIGSRYPVMTAMSGEEALRLAQQTQPTVIVLDVMLQGQTNGLAVFRELRARSATRDIPVVFLTGGNRAMALSFSADELERHLGHRPAASIEKPVASETLLQTVADAVACHGLGLRGEPRAVEVSSPGS